MAEQIIQGIALVAGVAAVAIPSVTAAFNIGRLFKAKGDHLVVEVGRQSFVIDIKAIDQTDIDVIDSATRAVEERSRLVAEERSGGNFDQANYRAA